MRWLFGENPDIHTFGKNLAAGNGKTCIIDGLPENNNSIGEEEGMGLKRKQMLLRQVAILERELQERLSFLSGKGIKSPRAGKDTLVRKWQADIRAVNRRLRKIAADEKRTEDMARIKAERAAAPQKEQEGGKGEKPKKAHEEGKGKKIKAEKKSAPPKAPEGGKSQPATEAPEGGKTAT